MLLAVDSFSPVAHPADRVKNKILWTSVNPSTHQAPHCLGAGDEFFARVGVSEVAGVITLHRAVRHQHRFVGQGSQVAKRASQSAVQVVVVVVVVISPIDDR